MNWKKQVTNDAQRKKQEKTQTQFDKSIFTRIKPKIISFSNKPEMEKYFIYLSKKMLLKLPDPALSIYPVLCTTADFKENTWFQMSRENIGKLAGISSPTVDNGLKTLSSQRLLEKRFQPKQRIHIYEYRVEFYRGEAITKNKKDVLQFYHHIVYNGTWARLNYDAKRLYFTMRAEARFEPELYGEIEKVEMEKTDIVEIEGADASEFYANHYSQRKWDIIYTGESADPYGYFMMEMLSELSGMSTGRVEKALKQLEQYELVQIIFDYQYLVHLRLPI